MTSDADACRMIGGKGIMAHTLEARFLGAPVIKKDGQEVFFPYNKVNALVYYILVKGTVMRDELSGILWGDKSDAIARKNLRNAIYETKKLLGPNVLSPHGRRLSRSIRTLTLRWTLRNLKGTRATSWTFTKEVSSKVFM